MSDKIGSASFEIIADTKRLKDDLRRAERDVKTAATGYERKIRKANDRIEADTKATTDALLARWRKVGDGIGRSMADASRVARYAFAGIVAYSIKAAASAAEVENAFNVAFGASSAGARKFSEDLAKLTGRDPVELREGMSRLQLVITGTGIEAGKSAKMVEALTSRAVDVGSLFNVKDADALQAMISGITGEAEPLKRFGVILNDTALGAELLRLGFKGTAQEATEEQKAVARLNIILAKTAVAQGDAANTADGAANKTKAMTAEFNKAARELGEQLLPAFVKVAGSATDALKVFNSWPAGMQVASLAILGFIAAGGPIAGLLSNLGKVIKLARDTRLAIMAIAGANVAAGAGGAAGGAAAGAGALTGALLGPAGAVAGLGGVAWAIATEKAKAYEGVLKDIKKATDEDLAAAKAYAEANIRSFDRSPSRVQAAIDRRSGFSAATYAILTEQQRRAREARAGGGSAGVDTSVVGGFGLPPGGGGDGGGGSGRSRAASDSYAGKTVEIVSIDPEITRLLDLLEYWRGVEERGNAAAQIDQNPEGFVSSAERVAEATRAIDETQQYQREAFREAFTGGLLSALQGGSQGFEDWIRQGAERGLEKALNNLADLIFDLFSQAGGGGIAGQGGGGIMSSIGSVLSTVFGGARAYGGPVTAGRAYRVGENGPETLIAPANGMIIPKGGFAGAAQGGPGGGMALRLMVAPSPYFDAHVEQVAGPIAAGLVVEGVKHMEAKSARAQRAAGFGIGRR